MLEPNVGAAVFNLISIGFDHSIVHEHPYKMIILELSVNSPLVSIRCSSCGALATNDSGGTYLRGFESQDVGDLHPDEVKFERKRPERLLLQTKLVSPYSYRGHH